VYCLDPGQAEVKKEVAVKEEVAEKEVSYKTSKLLNL
jgi:hypothetical protein